VAAQPVVADSAAPVATEPEAAEDAEEKKGGWLDDVVIGGYAEAYYGYNFARPQNGITNNRWLDERSNAFTLQTVGLDLGAKKGPFEAKLSMMFGPTADRWYFEGARIPDSETGVLLSPAGYNNETWKHIQQAWGGYTAPIGNGLTLQGGLFTTQVGYEAAPVKDNWNWSRSNLFNFLPFFHVGSRLVYPITDSWSVTAAVYNGWNQASDLNSAKSMSLQSSWVGSKWLANVLYFGGVERPRYDAGGSPWRHMFDAVGQYEIVDWLSVAGHANAGFEHSDLGDHRWFAGALYARAKATRWLMFALRGDGIREHVPADGGAILLGGADHILSATGTVELRPVGDHFSLRLEYRHDDSDRHTPLFFRRGYDAAGLQRLAATQNTFTVGVTGWF
jgi:Putative beta-barrel porin-2, OmpL-like. bbp2